ncbi:TPA: hypothetical protein DDZ86_00970 [Candidatus Dependentiae bacterium]|nr:MAG: hypothetical protein UW09_C0004G0076 [candidate division TM6 bacterium GW2011_GWF2_43_87]HBL98197.1 hypothetical protein [Candidatus Dependentiae bacterium]
MKIYRIFFRLCAVGFLFIGTSVFPSNNDDQIKLMYKVVEAGDVEMVQKMVEVDPSLKTNFYENKPFLWPLLRATRLKNKVEESKLKDYAKIIGLLGKDAAALNIMKEKGCGVETFMPLDYSLRRCFPLIDKELLKFKPFPPGYVPKTEEDKKSLKKFAELFVGELSSFFVEQLSAMNSFFKENENAGPQEVCFIGSVKDGEGRLFSGVLKVVRGAKCKQRFCFKLYTQNKPHGEISFVIQRLNESSPTADIGSLEVVKDERHNGMGGMLLDSLISALCTLEKNWSVSLLAYPLTYNNVKTEQMFLPLLIAFYKMRGFIPSKNSVHNLTLTIVDGKVQAGCDRAVLKKIKNKCELK